MQEFEFDFTYECPENLKTYVVAVTAAVSQSVAQAESDWDAKDYVEITEVHVWAKNGTDAMEYEEGFEIPEKVIYDEISAQIRAAEISRLFDEEDGGF